MRPVAIGNRGRNVDTSVDTNVDTGGDDRVKEIALGWD